MGILWARSTSIEFDSNGDPANGAKAYFYEGGTTTPLTVYQDAAEGTPLTSPVTANSIGRWPSVFIPYIATYDVKVTTSGGTLLYYPTDIANPDPVTTAEDTTLPEERIQTGMLAWMPKNGTLSGFVRANARTIGSAASGATERANADTANLYAVLWDIADASLNAICPVAGGVGANAAADFAANKYITLPDMRGGGPLGLDTMGNSAASSLGSATFTNGSATTAGSLCGENTHTLLAAELPITTPAGSISQITPAGSISQITPAGSVSQPGVTITDPGHNSTGLQTVSGIQTGGASNALQAGGGGHIGPDTTGITAALDSTPTFTGDAVTPTFTGTPTTPTFTGTPFGGGQVHNNVSKSILGTWYIKL